MNATEPCITEYAKIAREFPVLSRKDERKLLNTIRKYKSGKLKQEARETLFNSNIKLVLKQAHRYGYFPHISLEDLVSAGCEGLAIAIDRFDVEKKTKFSTYAIPWIQLKIYKVLNTCMVVHIPSNVLSGSYKYKKIMKSDFQLTDKELMEELKVSENGLRKVRIAQYRTLSLNQTAKRGEGDGSYSPTYETLIPDQNAACPSSLLASKEKREVIRAVVEGLPPVQREIIVSRYFTGKKVNLDSIGKKYKITGERVRQIEVIALNKMKRKLRNKVDFTVE